MDATDNIDYILGIYYLLLTSRTSWSLDTGSFGCEPRTVPLNVSLVVVSAVSFALGTTMLRCYFTLDFFM